MTNPETSSAASLHYDGLFSLVDDLLAIPEEAEEVQNFK
jgi:hypothetical protein